MAGKAEKKSSSSASAGRGRASSQAGGGGSGRGTVKEEETEGTGIVNPAAPTSASGGTGLQVASAADVKVAATLGSSSGVADSAYTGPRTRSRGKRTRS